MAARALQIVRAGCRRGGGKGVVMILRLAGWLSISGWGGWVGVGVGHRYPLVVGVLSVEDKGVVVPLDQGLLWLVTASEQVGLLLQVPVEGGEAGRDEEEGPALPGEVPGISHNRLHSRNRIKFDENCELIIVPGRLDEGGLHTDVVDDELGDPEVAAHVVLHRADDVCGL